LLRHPKEGQFVPHCIHTPAFSTQRTWNGGPQLGSSKWVQDPKKGNVECFALEESLGNAQEETANVWSFFIIQEQKYINLTFNMTDKE
jgi:hypothetical protein